MEFPNLSAARRIYIDLETRDPNLKKLGPGYIRSDGHVVGIAVGADGLPATYYPIAHAVGANYPSEHVLGWIQADVLDSGKPIGGHNLPYDIGWLLASGLRIGRTTNLRDSLIGATLLDEDLDHYSLDALGKLWLGVSKHEGGIRAYANEHRLDPKADLWRMPPEVVGPYACQDVDLTRQLMEHEEIEIAMQGALWDAYKLESDLIPLSILMRQRGIRIDEEKLEQAGPEFRIMMERAIDEIDKLTGERVDIWRAASCAGVLAKAGITVPTTKKGSPSITAPWLKALDHPVGNLLLRARKAAKAQNTFTEGWKAHVVNGRIHPEFHQTRSDEGGTISFRYSCSNPNLQQVPYRDKDMAAILRPIFLPDDGEALYSLDYSQQEPRLLVHYAYENFRAGVPIHGAEEAHTRMQDPEADFHQIATDLTGLTQRTIVKEVNLGVIYGQGALSLSKKIGKTLVQTKEILATYQQRLPFMYGMSNLCRSTAERRGYLKTLGGHRRRFDLWEPVQWVNRGEDDDRVVPLRRAEAEKEWPGKALRRAYIFTALNALIQTSAAAQMKRAMLACYGAGIIPSLQIHDELLVSGDDATATQAVKYMVESTTLNVPTIVDVASGSNWLEAS